MTRSHLQFADRPRCNADVTSRHSSTACCTLSTVNMVERWHIFSDILPSCLQSDHCCFPQFMLMQCWQQQQSRQNTCWVYVPAACERPICKHRHFGISLQSHLLMTSTMADTSDATADTGAIGVLVRHTSPKNSCSPKASTYTVQATLHCLCGRGQRGRRWAFCSNLIVTVIVTYYLLLEAFLSCCKSQKKLQRCHMCSCPHCR